MKAYLVKNGIPFSAIILDNAGADSYETAQNTKTFMTQNNLNSVIIVSSYFHIARTKLAFAKFGISNVSSAHSNFFELRDIYSLLREIPAYYYYLFRKY